MKDGFEDISYGRFAQAVDRCAIWLKETAGKHEATSTSIGPKIIFASLPRHDLRGILLILAAPRVGRQVRYTKARSYWNILLIQMKMYWSQPFGETEYMLRALAGMDCDTFLKPDPCPNAVQDVLARRPLRTFALPHLEAWLSPRYDPNAQPYHCDLSEDQVQAEQQPISVFQTSGTTNEPKPIVVRLGSSSKHGTYQQLPDLGQHPWVCAHLAGHRVLSTFGWYQYAGLLFHVICAVYCDYVIVTAPEIHDWSAETIEAAILHGDIQSCYLYPGACVDFCLEGNKHRLPTLRQLKLLLFAGSSIPAWVGNMLGEYTRVGQLIGATEVSIFPQELPRDKKDWRYIRLHPQSGVEFRPCVPVDGAYHMVVVRQKKLEDWQPAFVNFPDMLEYEMGDLFERHPTDSDLWLSVGRIVELFVLQDGRVFNPVPIETDIAENPDVLLSMVCGLTATGKLVILLTPRRPLAEGERSCSEFVDHIWPSIEQSFVTKGPKWVTDLLDKNFVAVTPPGLPIQRTGGKWNVNRRKTLALHYGRLEKEFGGLTLSSTTAEVNS